MSNFTAWPLRTGTIGALGVTLGDGSATDLAVAQAALDGALPYNAAGLETYNYWTNYGGGYGTYFVGSVLTPRNDPMPQSVQQWLTAYQALPLVQAIQQAAQASVDNWLAQLDALLGLLGYIVLVERLQASGTTAAWVPPGGGQFPAVGLTTIVPGSDFQATVTQFQGRANYDYQSAISQFPGLLSTLPQAPFADLQGQSAQGGMLWGLVSTVSPQGVDVTTDSAASAAVTAQSSGIQAAPMQATVAIISDSNLPLSDSMGIPTGNAGVDNGGSPPAQVLTQATGPAEGGGGISTAVVTTGPSAQVANGNLPASPLAATPSLSTLQWIAIVAVIAIVIKEM